MAITLCYRVSTFPHLNLTLTRTDRGRGWGQSPTWRVGNVHQHWWWVVDCVARVKVYVRSIRPQQIQDHVVLAGKKYSQKARSVFHHTWQPQRRSSRGQRLGSLSHSMQTDSTYYQMISNCPHEVKSEECTKSAKSQPPPPRKKRPQRRDPPCCLHLSLKGPGFLGLYHNIDALEYALE